MIGDVLSHKQNALLSCASFLLALTDERTDQKLQNFHIIQYQIYQSNKYDQMEQRLNRAVLNHVIS